LNVRKKQTENNGREKEWKNKKERSEEGKIEQIDEKRGIKRMVY
jgi:hypothetical protein